jgi:protein involved in polysaccharide export with SLBB domain
MKINAYIIFICILSPIVALSQSIYEVTGASQDISNNQYLQQLTPVSQLESSSEGIQIPEYNAGAALAGSDYILGPGDEIVIAFWGIEDTSYLLKVSPQGSIIVPPIGDISVNGFSIHHLYDYLKLELSKYVKEPKFSIVLNNLRIIQIQVLGQVKSPGIYNLKSIDRVGQAFWAAKGPNPQASIRTVQLIRKGEIVATLDLYKYFIWNDQVQNPKLEAGDIIFVPIINNTIKIMGQVWKPGRYEVKEGERLMDIINMAGGLTPDASMEYIKINNIADPEKVNNVSVKKLIIDKNEKENVIIKNGDIITVPASPKTVTVVGQVQKGGTFLYEPGTLISYYLGLAGGYGERANTGNIKINRWGGKTIKARENTMVEPGDVIVIGGMEIKGWRDYLTVMGQAATLFFIIWQVAK